MSVRWDIGIVRMRCYAVQVRRWGGGHGRDLRRQRRGDTSFGRTATTAAGRASAAGRGGAAAAGSSST